MSKHTLGEWRATRSNPAEGFDVWWITAELPNGEREICSIPGGVATSEWNAILIAAAPDLLDALRNLVAVQPNLMANSAEIADARAAIAKAGGAS